MLITHDVNTVPGHAYQRLQRLPFAGVIVVPQDLPTAVAIEDVLLLLEGSLPGELEGQVLYVPL